MVATLAKTSVVLIVEIPILTLSLLTSVAKSVVVNSCVVTLAMKSAIVDLVLLAPTGFLKILPAVVVPSIVLLLFLAVPSFLLAINLVLESDNAVTTPVNTLVILVIALLVKNLSRRSVQVMVL